MGESKGFCGCMPYKCVAITALVLEILYLVGCILGRVQWIGIVASGTKVLLLLIALTCCKD